MVPGAVVPVDRDGRRVDVNLDPIIEADPTRTDLVFVPEAVVGEEQILTAQSPQVVVLWD